MKEEFGEIGEGDLDENSANEIVVKMPMNQSDDSILVVVFLTLCVLYFLLVYIGLQRVCSLEKPSGTSALESPSRILRTFVYLVVLASLTRFACWLLCTTRFYSNDEKFLKYAIYERIKAMTIKAKA